MRRCLFTAVIVGLASPVALAANDTHNAAPFAQLDKDQNGSISSQEFQAASRPTMTFAELDADRNNQLSRDEYGKLGNSRLQDNRTTAPGNATKPPPASSKGGASGY